MTYLGGEGGSGRCSAYSRIPFEAEIFKVWGWKGLQERGAGGEIKHNCGGGFE